MKVLLLKDVYKLGRAGDVKRVADGYGRNYLIPQRLAVLATQGAVKQAESIRQRASAQRTELNKTMGGLAERLSGMVIGFPSRAGETGKLYGSITTQMIAEEVSRRVGETVDRRDIETEPIRTLGEHVVVVHLTVDLNPEITVIAHREGEKPAALQQAQPSETETVEVAEPTTIVQIYESAEEPTAETTEENAG